MPEDHAIRPLHDEAGPALERAQQVDLLEVLAAPTVLVERDRVGDVSDGTGLLVDAAGLGREVFRCPPVVGVEKGDPRAR